MFLPMSGFSSSLWLTLATNRWDRLLDDASDARFVGDERLIFARGSELLMTTVDLAGGRVTGSSMPVLSNLYTTAGMAGILVTHYALDSAGTLIYLPRTGQTTDDDLLWVDRSGNETPVANGPGNWMHPRLAPAGDRAVFDIQDDAGMRDLYILELANAQLNRFTTHGTCFNTEWGQEGSALFYMRSGARGRVVVRQSADFSGQPEIIGQYDGSNFHLCEISPDGSTALLNMNPSDGVWSMSLEPPSDPAPLFGSSVEERWAQISPSGKWIAYVGTESGRREVFVEPYPERGPRIRVSHNGGGEPRWSHDESELFFREGEAFYTSAISGEEELRFAQPEVLFEGDYDASFAGHQHYDVTPDGQRFLVVKHGDRQMPSTVRVIQNWAASLPN
jgi:Tol biopolymer transport system component